MIIKYETSKYGSKCWYQNDQLHRTDGPAIEFVNGTKKWYQNGKLHRTDGPAMEWDDGVTEWFIEGKEYPEEEYYNSLVSK
jgi:hypothetical protein